jgi:urea transport system ATP-binding protein
MLKATDIDLFYGASQALHGVSLHAEQGKVTCILGRNGVGKTSLIRALSGLSSIKSGSLHLNGNVVTTMTPADRAKHGIALVPQGREIFAQLTVEENLKTGFAVLPRKERNIPEEIFSLFPVLKSMLQRRGGDLSGGQQQQLSIARALVMRPKVLLLDEPTEGIQPSIIKDIERVISTLRDRGTMAIVLVEQYFDFAKQLADSFIVLDRGRMVMTGDRQILQTQDVRAHLTV